VLLIVLITLVFATVAMFAFIERASNDLLVEKRSSDATRLRLEAYSALETTLAVLEDFRQANGMLRSPSEGWGDPLAFAGYQPAEGRTVEVAFEDESGKYSLPNATQATLVNLFKAWEISDSDAAKLADAILGWMKKDYVASSAGAPDAEDYEREEIPYDPPGRPLRSFGELATIAVARDLFYDEAGQPNALWHRFVSAFSLYSFQSPSINGASPELLAGLGITDTMQQKQLDDYIHGRGLFENKGAGYFKSAQDVSAMFGAQSPAAALSTQISSLRIIVTVREGRSSFRINALIAPPGGATIPVGQTNQASTTNPNDSTANSPSTTSTAAATAQTTKKLNYPFTILEFRENDEMPSPPPPAST
jgi:general secretion pathway protein K